MEGRGLGRGRLRGDKKEIFANQHERESAIKLAVRDYEMGDNWIRVTRIKVCYESDP